MGKTHRSLRKWVARTASGITALLMFMIVVPFVHAQCLNAGDNWTCSGNVGTTTLTGTSATNIFSFLAGVTGQIFVTSGGGSGDTLDFSTFTTDVTVNLNNTSTYQSVAAGLTILFSGFNTAGQTYTINGGSGNDVIHGGQGNDTINGNAGNDRLSGGWLDNPDIFISDDSGDDTIFGGDDNDFIFGGNGQDTLYGENGNDDLHGYYDDDFVSGGEGDDILHGNHGTDIVEGNAGNDVLTGGLGVDILDGGDGDDLLSDTYDGCKDDTFISVEAKIYGLTCVAVPAPVPVVPTPGFDPLPSDLCRTLRTRVALDDRGVLLIFSDFQTTPNGMMITEIPLASLRNPTDDEKAADAWVPLIAKDSEFAPGWSVGLYWHANHYGFQIYQNGTLFDDTDAICGWF